MLFGLVLRDKILETEPNWSLVRIEELINYFLLSLLALRLRELGFVFEVLNLLLLSKGETLRGFLAKFKIMSKNKYV